MPRNPGPRVLLRSSWQTVNIGDIAHTPGVLRLIEMHLPHVAVTLWPCCIDNGVDELLMARFPKLTIIRSEADRERAFAECDLLLHGSSADLGARDDMRHWHEATGKPYGIYGITLPPKGSYATRPATPEEQADKVEVINGASFVFFRDSRSLAYARELGATCPEMAFGPDGAFGCDLRDDATADAFLAANDLTPGQFLCCIPRLRYSPYWVLPEKNRAIDPVKHARNEEMKEQDHRPLREAIIAVVRQTKMKVLICPEDRTQMQVGRALLYEPLPADVRERVVWRPDYWLTGEAISTYCRSAGLFGNEMHSAIMCIAHGVPAVVCRWAEQTSKGYMWADIGLADWLFDLDDPAQRVRVAATVLAIARDPAAASATADAARLRVEDHQRRTMDVLAKALG